MTARLNPYLSFDGNARQAMEYYKDVFGGELSISTFGEFGQADTPQANKIMHSQLKAEGNLTLMASDMPPGTEYHPGNNIAVSISGNDSAKLRGYWEKLSDRGKIQVALEKQVWGDEFGMCIDQFGIEWMVDIAQPQT